MKALCYVLAIIGALCIMNALPESIGGILVILIGVVSVLVLAVVIRFVIKIIAKIFKAIDDSF